ncbi:hypothetical protein [Sinorhizobium sp. RAC02]|uniref:hypothetical protein n=1 Tax=Sinorhizobium sp. RAC02 TaxID=1842534 RepID=UPI00083CC653|nr:hypothetical protein [Sinorhizobium sp. RAC02]AOF92574.1 hypothetical protein BSY16_5060 [Sinorhizobium sp. RAC02]
MISAIASLLKNSLKSRSQEERDDRNKVLDTVLSGGSGSTRLTAGREQQTLHQKYLFPETSREDRGSKPARDEKENSWVQFNWPDEHHHESCTWHNVSWRFYRTGFVTVSMGLSVTDRRLDLHDLLGHRIELRDKSGFLLGVWSAAFQVWKGVGRMGYQSSASEDFLPLKQHFDDIALVQEGQRFSI